MHNSVIVIWPRYWLPQTMQFYHLTLFGMGYNVYEYSLSVLLVFQPEWAMLNSDIGNCCSKAFFVNHYDCTTRNWHRRISHVTKNWTANIHHWVTLTANFSSLTMVEIATSSSLVYCYQPMFTVTCIRISPSGSMHFKIVLFDMCSYGNYYQVECIGLLPCSLNSLNLFPPSLILQSILPSSLSLSSPLPSLSLTPGCSCEWARFIWGSPKIPQEGPVL